MQDALADFLAALSEIHRLVESDAARSLTLEGDQEERMEKREPDMP
jgi:hypothetical protein